MAPSTFPLVLTAGSALTHGIGPVVQTIQPHAVYSLHIHGRRWILLCSFYGMRLVGCLHTFSHAHPDPRSGHRSEWMAWFQSSHFSAESYVIFAFPIFGNAAAREPGLNFEDILKYYRNQKRNRQYFLNDCNAKRGIAREVKSWTTRISKHLKRNIEHWKIVFYRPQKGNRLKSLNDRNGKRGGARESWNIQSWRGHEIANKSIEIRHMERLKFL